MRSKFKWIFTLLLAFSMQFSFAQEKTVTGTVTEGGLPLPGVSVVVKGTTRGTQSDMDGNYSIKAKAGEVLVFSFIGMKDATAAVGASSKINVAMAAEAKQLENVVIGALGIKKRADAVTSTNQVVKTKELTQAANPNVVQSLAGKVSGLQINLTANGANPTSRIVLRGNRSITGNNQALVVIDNAISSATLLQQLPPDVIESVSVVKGQQGSALYGELGANGVIIVTTKKGSATSKMEVSINSSVDFQNVSFLPKRQTKYGQGWTIGNYDYTFPDVSDPRNGTQYAPLENGAWGPAFDDPAWAGTVVPVGLPQADGSILMNEWKSRGSDNIKDFFRTGTIFQTGATINVGGEDGYALLNVSRQNTDFIVENDGLKRNSFLFKAGKKFGKLKIDGNASYTNQTVTQTDSGLLFDLIQTPTNVDINKFRNSGTLHHWTVYARNPWQVIKQIRNDDKTNNFNGVLGLNYELTKNITVSYTGNMQLNSTISTSHNDGFSGDMVVDYSPYLVSSLNGLTYVGFGGSTNHVASNFFVSTNTARNYYGDLMLNFNYDLTKDLNMKLNLGQNIQDFYRRFTKQGGTQLNVPGWYNIKNVTKPENPSKLANGIEQIRRMAHFGNLDLDYKGYLFLNATGRYERSSTIPGKSFFYPSVGVSFVPTRAFEGLTKGNVLNYAKLYANFVKAGNTSAVLPYAITDTAPIPAGFPYTNASGGQLSAYQPRYDLVSKNIKPEFTVTKEVGANFGFFNDRITLEGSVYTTDTQKLITNATTSTTILGQKSLDNTGLLRNNGFEIDLGLNPFRSENGFNWNVKTGFTKYKTVVKSLSAGVDEVSLATGPGVGIYAMVGEEYPMIKTTDFERDSNGNIIVGANGIPSITSALSKVGKVNPDYIINLTNTFSYKGLSLTAVADYRAGGSVWSQTYNQMMFAGYTLDSAEFDRSAGYIVPGSVINTGTLQAPIYTPNTTTSIAPGNLANYYGVLDGIGSTSVVDASAIKIRELALGYSLPSKMLKNTGVSSFKVGVNARNPFIFFMNSGVGMKNEGYTDPEASFTEGNGQGISGIGQYPTTKTYGVSLNITF